MSDKGITSTFMYAGLTDDEKDKVVTDLVFQNHTIEIKYDELDSPENEGELNMNLASFKKLNSFKKYITSQYPYLDPTHVVNTDGKYHVWPTGQFRFPGLIYVCDIDNEIYMYSELCDVPWEVWGA